MRRFGTFSTICNIARVLLRNGAAADRARAISFLGSTDW
jgi:hypothetical protein